jgi:hypothetical protein
METKQQGISPKAHQEPSIRDRLLVKLRLAERPHMNPCRPMRACSLHGHHLQVNFALALPCCRGSFVALDVAAVESIKQERCQKFGGQVAMKTCLPAARVAIPRN